MYYFFKKFTKNGEEWDWPVVIKNLRVPFLKIGAILATFKILVKIPDSTNVFKKLARCPDNNGENFKDCDWNSKTTI